MVVPTTKIQAVNTLLDVISESPVTTLGENADATAAETVLDEVNMRVQSRGWYFNTHIQDLTINESGKFPLGTSVSRFDWPRSSPDDPDLVLRFIEDGAAEVYDRKNNTTTFEVGKVFKDCHITSLLEFTRLPEAARQFIMISAARTFQARRLTSNQRERFSFEQERRAEAEMKREELKAGDFSSFSSPIANNILHRRAPLNFRY